MARILAYTSPARGHLYPIIPTLQELRSRGHEVAVRSLASEVGLLQRLGFAAAAIDPAVEGRTLDDWRSRTPIGALQASLRAFAQRALHDGPDLRRAIAAERPDVLLVDVNAWGAAAAAETSGLPWAAWCPYLLPLPSRDAPPYGLGLQPDSGPLGRLRDVALRPLLSGLYKTALPGLNAARAALGAAPLRAVSEVYLRAPLLLYLTAEPFEYRRGDWHPSVRMVGPGLWDPPAAPPDWLAAVEGPLVLVTCSTEFQNDGRLVSAALEALRDEALQVVVTTGGVDPVGFAPPANARIERFLPHAPLLERAACVVCHGGMGITQKALAAGVPVCVVPFGRDQHEVARRVLVAGAGTRLPAGSLRPDRLRAAVREAMGRKSAAERLAAAFREAGGPVAAASAVEALRLAPAVAAGGSVALRPG